MQNEYWVYILETKIATFYTGYTTNLNKRYKDHVKGTVNCKYTRSFGVKKLLVAWKVIGSKNIALKIESFIKRHDKNFKKKLINNPKTLSILLQKKFDEWYELIVVEQTFIDEINSGR